MAVSAREIITGAIIFFVIAIVLPIAITAINNGPLINSTWGQSTGYSGSANNTRDSATWTIFSILLPILAVIGMALYFLPRIGK